MESAENIIGSFTRYKRESTVRYIDWEKAKELCLEHPNCSIYAGIKEDMANTGGPIYNDGKWITDGYVYDRSYWGTPVVEIFDENTGSEIQIPCWTTDPHEHTRVPAWWGKG